MQKGGAFHQNSIFDKINFKQGKLARISVSIHRNMRANLPDDCMAIPWKKDFVEKIVYNKVRNLLEKLRREVPGNVFMGAGIVIYESLDNLPVFLLGSESKVGTKVNLLSSLINSSVATNPHHDGFSLISKDFQITHKNVYFAPPIDSSVEFDPDYGYGTRYVAALMGSKIEGILMTAVISNSYGIVVFKNGREISE